MTRSFLWRASRTPAGWRPSLVVATVLAMSSAVPAQTLTWTGATNGDWDTTTANWAGTASVFSNGSTVTFNDTATGTTGITTAAAISPAGTVTVNNSTKDYSFSGAGGLSGTLNLTKLGAGALTLSNSNTFTGTLTLRGGTTTLAGSGVVAATGAGFTAIASSTGDSATLVVKDSARLTTNGNFYVGNLAGANGTVLMQSGTIEHVGGFFRVGSDGNGTLNQSGGLITLTAAGVLPTVGRFSTSTSSMMISSGTFQLTGSNSVLQVGAAGSGSLTVSGNGFVDTGTSSGNTLRIVAQIAQGTGVVNLDGGTIRTRQVDTTGIGVASSTFNFNGGTLIAVTSNANFLTGLTAANIKSGGARIDTNGNPITIAQRLLDGTGGGGLTKIGAGTLTLSGSNTYTGTTTISGGVLSANQSNALGAGGSITLAGGTLQFTAASAGQDWASRFKNSSSAIALDTNGQNVSLAGAIDNTNVGGLTKLSSGTLTLTGTSSYRGDTTVSAGTFLLSGNGAVTTGTAGMLYVGRNAGDAGTLLLQNNASLSVGQIFVGNAAGSTGTVTITGGTLAAAFDGNFLARIGASGTATWNQSGGLATLRDLQPTLGRLAGGRGEMTVSSGSFMVTGTTSNATMNVGSLGAGVLTISGNGLVETGTGLSGGLTLVNSVAGNTTGSGIVNLDGGTLRTRYVATSGTGGAVSTFNFNGGTLVALTPNATFMQGLTAANVKAGGAVIDTNGNGISIAQALLDGGGGGGLTKNGAGALTLAGANTYTGSTVVNGGTLVANGSLAGGVSVGAGGVLAGSGSVGAISGAGLIGPGNSPGILTATSVDPAGNMSFAFEFSGTAPNYGSPSTSVNDLLWLTGGTPFTASLTSANAVNLYLTPAAAEAGTLTGGFFTAGQTDFLASIQGAAFSYFVQDPAGTFSYGGQTYKTLLQYDPSKSVTISTVAANGGQVMQMVVVPEPGTVVLAGMGVALAAWMGRRRRS